MQEHRIEVAGRPDGALQAVDRAAEFWGAEWQRQGSSGRLSLPVTAGLRYGVLNGHLWVEPGPTGCEVVFRVEETNYSLHGAAVVILVISALGALVTVVWPFIWPFFPRPETMALASLGAVLALIGWFLIVSRLRSRGAEEFLDVVAAFQEAEAGVEGDPPAGGGSVSVAAGNPFGP